MGSAMKMMQAPGRKERRRSARSSLSARAWMSHFCVPALRRFLNEHAVNMGKHNACVRFERGVYLSLTWALFLWQAGNSKLYSYCMHATRYAGSAVGADAVSPKHVQLPAWNLGHTRAA